MKCKILFYGKNKKNLINLSSAESTHSVVSNNSQMSVRKKSIRLFLSNGFISFTLSSDYLLTKLLN